MQKKMRFRSVQFVWVVTKNEEIKEIEMQPKVAQSNSILRLRNDQLIIKLKDYKDIQTKIPVVKLDNLDTKLRKYVCIWKNY